LRMSVAMESEVTDKVNILMVDDQPGKLLSYEAILGDLGENLIKARSGREGLEQLLKHDVAVVLLDVSMPEIDGFEMADMMRQHPRFQKTAILFISAVRMSDLDRIKGYKSGAVDYISVPVVPDILRAKVSVFADLHRKTRQLEVLNRELEWRVEERTRQLQESENQFRTLANSIPQLAWMANAKGEIFWYNDRWLDYTGVSVEDTQSSDWTTLFHQDHRARVSSSVRLCLETGGLWEETAPIRGKDGQYRWFLSRAVPIRDATGKVVRWFGTSTDISGQIAAEEKIRQLNSQLEQRLAELETIMQVLPLGVSVAHDSECKLITANQALSDLLKLPVGDNISKSTDSAGAKLYGLYRNGLEVAPHDLPLQRAIATARQVAPEELEIRRRDGTAVEILGSATPLFDSEGMVRGAVGAFVDVTARKKMEDLLRERADLLELASEAVLVRDQSGVLQYWNAGAEALYGWKREEVLGTPIHTLLETSFPSEGEQIEFDLNSLGRWDGNLHQKTRDGREVIVASRQVFKKESSSILEINRDITAQTRTEDALRATEKLAAMGRVAGIIAHEINNPLESITNAFYLLEDHPSLDHEAKYFAKLGSEELQRVCHITKQTLGFYRESDVPVDVSVRELVDDVLELQNRRLQLNKIALEKRFLNDGIVRGFPVELRQIFFNLIGNAIQAMPDGGKLRITLAERWNDAIKRPELTLSICDTGSGILPEHAQHLFEPFFTTKSSKGTGLGLWISKGIVQKYDGTIQFRSIPLRGGNVTSFRITLPCLDPSPGGKFKASLVQYSADAKRSALGRK
jgi:PAS domain S-box-containing protein